MAIKIQGSTIIDDDKNIKDNTGFYSDNTNSALRPRSSSGTSFIQRWSGSSWQDLASFNNASIQLNRNVNLAAGYTYSGNGSGLTDVPAITLNGFRASESTYNSSWYSRIPVVAGNGVLEIGKFIDFHSASNDANDYTYRLDNYSNGNLSTSGNLLVNGSIFSSTSNGSNITTVNGNQITLTGNNVNITIGGDNRIELSGGTYQYIDFGGGDYQGRIIQEGANMSLTARNNLIFGPDNNIIVRGVDATDAEVRVMRLNSNNVVKKANIGSSRRYKSNIINLTTESFDKIYNITPVSFNYNEDCVEGKDLTGKGNYLKMGVIAEDIEQFMPEVVQYGYFSDQYIDIDGKKVLKEDPVETPMSVNYESIFICAVGALQELRQRVIDLEEEVQTLKTSLQTP
jgi:hypothetical protein